MKKLTTYLPFALLFFVPLVFYPLVDSSGWRSNSDVHALLEFASSLLAITAGIMILLHFLTTGRSFFLVLSVGFVLIGVEEFVHALFSFNKVWLEIPSTFKLAISTTWLMGHFTLLSSFYIALLLGKKEIVSAKRRRIAVLYNLIGFVCAASVSVIIFNFSFLPDFVQLGSITKKLIELSLVLLYFIVFIFYFKIYLHQEFHSPILWSITAFIICRVLIHIFAFDAHDFYDAHWDVAHLLVFLSYFFPIFGIWGETMKLHRISQLQMVELAKEMAEHKLALEMLKESEEEVRYSNEIRKQLIKRMIEIRENERALISREIHDQLGQSMTALKLDLIWLEENALTNTEVKVKLSGMVDLITDTISDVQRISSELRLGILDDLGLAAAIEWYAEEFEKRTKLEVIMDLDEIQTKSDSKNLALYRVLQESLTNVIRHAQAKTVQINLHENDQHLILDIIDDGIGIPVEKLNSIRSLGLLGMHERIDLAGGTMEILRGKSSGTIIRICIPIEEALQQID